MGNRAIGSLLLAFRSPDSCDDAWAEFLESYSAALYQTARSCTSNDDSAADCYLHICERLARKGFRRLLKFNPEGSASFTTWLHVVARNLCFDWYRSQHGRLRLFKSLQHLSPLDLEVYNSRIVHGSSQQETLLRLHSRFPGIGLFELSEIEDRLQRSLTSRQQWILSARRSAEFSAPCAVENEDGEPVTLDVADPSPNPEEQITDQEEQARLRHCVEFLSAHERLLLQLRFEQELSLDEIARLCGLPDAQRVYRSLATVLKKLRDAME